VFSKVITTELRQLFQANGKYFHFIRSIRVFYSLTYIAIGYEFPDLLPKFLI
jgi:hypothetical protein